MGSSSDAILKTLLYADIFNYPLNKLEIYEYLISKEKIDKNLVFSTLRNPPKSIKSKNNYFFLLGKDLTVNKRLEKERISAKKYKKLKKILSYLEIIPSIKLIGVSGGLSVNNADLKDDIDIFVIAENGLTWTTRFFLVLFLKILGVYRTKKSKNVSDKICLNMILDEKSMQIKSKDIYTAHEIIQLVPVFNRNNTYKKFINSNIWVKEFLPNANLNKKPYVLKKQKKIYEKIIILIFKVIFLEEILGFIQFEFMKHSITKEVIKKGFLSFHPFNYKQYVLNAYKKKLREFSIEQ